MRRSFFVGKREGERGKRRALLSLFYVITGDICASPFFYACGSGKAISPMKKVGVAAPAFFV